MYLDLKKVAQWAGTAAGVLLLGFGLVSYIFSATVTEQIAATLDGILGLALVWFMAWLREGNPAPKAKVVKPEPARVDDPADRWRRR